MEVETMGQMTHEFNISGLVDDRTQRAFMFATCDNCDWTHRETNTNGPAMYRAAYESYRRHHIDTLGESLAAS